MDWSIQQIARHAGVTSRTLRHYDDIGLLPPARVGANGYRYYDQASLVRLQRILLLRELGVSLPAIRDSLERSGDAPALRRQVTWLRAERDRIDRQIRAVELTLRAQTEGVAVSAEDALDGFDQSRYREEVVDRWGTQAWDRGQQWWSAMGAEDRAAFRGESADIAAAYAACRAAGAPVDGVEVQAIAERHYRWVGSAWQTASPEPAAFAGLGEMYVADERFAAQYGGTEGAAYVRDAMRAFAASRGAA